MDALPEPSPFDVTCHTEGCENADVTLRVMAETDGPHVQCGPCGQPITDFTLVDEAPGE